jgi:hypothetical protein
MAQKRGTDECPNSNRVDENLVFPMQMARFVYICWTGLITYTHFFPNDGVARSLLAKSPDRIFRQNLLTGYSRKIS